MGKLGGKLMEMKDLLCQQDSVVSIKEQQVWFRHPNIENKSKLLGRVTVRLTEPERVYLHSFIGQPYRIPPKSLFVPRTSSTFSPVVRSSGAKVLGLGQLRRLVDFSVDASKRLFRQHH